jgi:hypothetical protein
MIETRKPSSLLDNRLEQSGPGVLVAIALLLALGLIVIWWGGLAPALEPPPVQPGSAMDTEFSAERARKHLREITRKPRSVGSTGHAQTRAYLIDELIRLGLESEVQYTTAVRLDYNLVTSAEVHNVMARIEGADSSAAIVLMTHYDSEVHSPGAADAGNGVAAILETARALQAGPALENDVIVLFTDAEEVGLFGARAFVDEHPWADDVGIVLNAEGRGNAGPVNMFRTAGGNGRMIEIMARNVPSPVAESLSHDLFGIMPNDTDLTIFARAGHSGMDFANVHGLPHYHTPLDSYEHADPRTLQHHGEYLLHLARAFGSENLTEIGAPDRVYFTVPIRGLVHYPMSWALPLALLALVLTLGLMIRERQRGYLGLTGTVGGVAVMLLMLMVLPFLAVAGWVGLRELVPEYSWFGNGTVYFSTRYLAGICLLVMAVQIAIFGLLRRRLQLADHFISAMLVWSLLGLASALWLPGGSYLLFWPMLIMLGGYLLFKSLQGWKLRAVICLVFSFPVLYFMVSLIQEINVALTLDMIGVPVFFLLLTVALLTLPVDLIYRGLGRNLPAGLALAGMALLVWALNDTGFDEYRKKPNSIEYIADHSENEAAWYSRDPEPDDWTRQFLGENPHQGPLPDWAPAYLRRPQAAWHRPTEVLMKDQLQAFLIGISSTGSEQIWRVLVIIPEETFSTVIDFGEQSPVQELTINDRKAVKDSGEIHRVIHFGSETPGVWLTLTTELGIDEVELVLRSNIPGFPKANYIDPSVRPIGMMPASPTADRTRLQRTIVLSQPLLKEGVEDDIARVTENL